MKLDMQGKRAIVTGGSRGIGKAVIENLVAEGVAVATCARGEDALQKQLSSWAEQGATVHGRALDVTDESAYTAWLNDSIEQLGGLDILVSNVTTRIESQGLDRWREAFEVDLMQHIRAFHQALPHLKQGSNPAVLFVASIASVMNANMPTEVEYGTMKAALVSFATQMANQYGPDNIRVNLVSPGPIHHEDGFWEMVQKHQPELYKRAAAISVFDRMGTPQEVANAITFLCSPAASNITAVNMRIDGGAIKTVNF